MTRRTLVLAVPAVLALATAALAPTDSAAPSPVGMAHRNVPICSAPVTGDGGCDAIRHDSLTAAGGLVSGGITGACLGTGAGLLASSACGAAGGAAGSMMNEWVSGGSVNDWGAVGTEAAFGSVVGGVGGLLSKKLGLELTQGQIRSWSNLRNSEVWLPGRITANYWKNSWLGGLIDGPRSVIYSYLAC